jgi:AcrR family transcriptional regulator
MNKVQKKPEPGANPDRRKRRSQDELINRLVQSAAEEFKRVGYAGATTAAIARNAEVTEAQLFRYFGSKANLFRESIFKPLDEQLRNFLKDDFPDKDNYPQFRQGSARYIESLRTFLSENVGAITSLIVAETYDQEATKGVFATDSLRRYFDRGASNMSQWSDHHKVDPKLMVRVSFAAVLACVMFKDWIFPPGLATDEAINSAISDFVLEGISVNHPFVEQP